MSISDVTARVALINSELSSLATAFTPPTSTTASTTSSAGSTGASMSFSSQLSNAITGTTATTGTTGTSGLPSKASTMLTSGQQTFATRLAADTGLDSGVVSAWLLAEESGGAAVSRQSASNNDWLNIGYTDSGTYGSSDNIWADPSAAADATAGWLKGQNTIPGYGTASSGIQSILSTAGQAPAAQISALQNSGWASSGYPSLPSLYQQVAG
ncbi:MAG TPA: hypothetical protein VHW96_19765 [Solirubrobacteraceae bacterium]|nr:hypothetical protein [Solirubrobacteraceae bacterium]